MDELAKIKQLCVARQIQMTEHALKRAIERSINFERDLVPTLLSGKIIEEYPDDYPYKSYLILGTTINQKYMHVVCAIGDNILWIITAYFPDKKEWEDDLKTRKEL